MKKYGLVALISCLCVLTVSLSGCSGHSEAVKNGPLVIGTIVSVTQTGTYYNNNPQLEVTLRFVTDEGQEITASDRKIVALIDLAQFQKGARVPLRYNPENPEDITMAFGLDDETLQQALDKLTGKSGEDHDGVLLK
ncbi:MAG: DUF3592 domain-containing protein [Peptococcaceae bacterium]|nr:DUF3592 domain-containing protein [Peptococcaceae bacterium]